MKDKFLTIAEVAENLQLSAQGVRALIQSGDLPAIQVGARRL
jgi:DNA binding domain protein, excisionase family